MDYKSFLADVQKRGNLRSPEESAAVTAAVIRAVAETLPMARVEKFAEEVPPELMVYLRGAHEEPDPYFDRHLFLGWVLSTVDATGSRDKSQGGLDLYVAYSEEEAERRCLCVFGALKALLSPEHVTLMNVCLPEDIQPLFARL
jgi:uncharacterized protein (DUF2267 family)